MSNHINGKVDQEPFTFSWERNHGSSVVVSKIYSPDQSNMKKETTHTKKQLPVLLPPPPYLTGTTQKSFKNVSRHGSWRKEEDPFYVAYMKCTMMDRKEDAKRGGVVLGKRIVKENGFGFGFGFGFSCNSSHSWRGVRDDAVIRLPRQRSSTKLIQYLDFKN